MIGMTMGMPSPFFVCMFYSIRNGGCFSSFECVVFLLIAPCFGKWWGLADGAGAVATWMTFQAKGGQTARWSGFFAFRE
jgi:hypothetical protein